MVARAAEQARGEAPNVLAVGGTNLYVSASGAISSETAWTPSRSGGQTWSGGGGVSQEFAGRDVPDVATVVDGCVGCGLCEHACRKMVKGTPALVTVSRGRGEPLRIEDLGLGRRKPDATPHSF